VLACGPSSGINCFPSSDTDFMGTELGNLKQGGPIRKSVYRTKKLTGCLERSVLRNDGHSPCSKTEILI
jgi:uridine kinase